MFMNMYLKMTIFSTKIAKFTTTFLYELIMAHEWVQWKEVTYSIDFWWKMVVAMQKHANIDLGTITYSPKMIIF